ncbi:MAG TPA: ROK family protein [Gaiellales bacterium]|nr:ROK family protein [Gaiellales bacterium]
MEPVVGVDLGGTSVKAALVSPELELLARDSAPTDVSDEDRLLTEIEQLVRRVAGGRDVAGVGFGLPSQIDQRRGVVADSINVPITDVPFLAEMERRLGLPVKIDNDANVACLAEARIGAAKGRANVIMLTLGTGVGGGIVLDGQLYHGATGYGGELGHMVVDENGPPCQGHCPNHGCLESLASATGVRLAAQEIAAERPSGTLARAIAEGGAAEVRVVIDSALEGDEDCVAALGIVGRHLGVGIANYVNIFNPDVVVVGGGIMAAGEILLGVAREEAGRRALRPPWREVEVVAAELGNDAGVLGAAALVL